MGRSLFCPSDRPGNTCKQKLNLVQPRNRRIKMTDKDFIKELEELEAATGVEVSSKPVPKEVVKLPKPK